MPKMKGAELITEYLIASDIPYALASAATAMSACSTRCIRRATASR